MKRWMVVLKFEQKNQEQIRSLVPAERAHVGELMNQKVLEAIYIAGDNSQVWLVINSTSAEEVEKLLADFPLHKYFESEATALL